jgi:hypothetical protein
VSKTGAAAARKAHDKLFISQDVLESWVDAGKVTFKDRVLTIVANQRSYTLAPALRFLSLLDGEDTGKLLGKIRLVDQVRTLGGEQWPTPC